MEEKYDQNNSLWRTTPAVSFTHPQLHIESLGKFNQFNQKQLIDKVILSNTK